MSDLIRIATRQSALALWQAEHVAAALRAAHPGLRTTLVPRTTRGDAIQDRPLSTVGGKGLFTRELEQALLEGAADIAVHSMKDVPVDLPDGFMLAAALPRHNPFEAFVSNRYTTVAELPAGARIGTSSLRRRAQLAAQRPDLVIENLRGNVQTRLAKLDAGKYDAILLAVAGLQRLGLDERIASELPAADSLPAIGQGVLGIECLTAAADMRARLAVLNDADSHTCLRAERAMNRRLHGGCDTPVAGFAELSDTQLRLRGLVAMPDGSRVLRADHTGPADDPEALGLAVAGDLLAQGAEQILRSLSA